VSIVRTLRPALALAVLAIAGIIGMLVFDGVGDVAAFLLASVPLIVGVGALVWRRGWDYSASASPLRGRPAGRYPTPLCGVGSSASQL
jgi:hypothetical protein